MDTLEELIGLFSFEYLLRLGISGLLFFFCGIICNLIHHRKKLWSAIGTLIVMLGVLSLGFYMIEPIHNKNESFTIICGAISIICIVCGLLMKVPKRKKTKDLP